MALLLVPSGRPGPRQLQNPCIVHGTGLTWLYWTSFLWTCWLRRAHPLLFRLLTGSRPREDRIATVHPAGPTRACLVYELPLCLLLDPQGLVLCIWQF
ncbi:hypothetical protein NDU88_004625 [Pleurodeles waltl]|uniref:Uncharacterized protein n=1 Tax=Pleurodeles waltl TaxID=8319 RepID=A0AAV7UG14_PLEWA|nr:hypothetical protein NDU88_004625 [Pleurodeles waltl]